MYLWIGCKLPEEYEKEIRSHCLALNRQIGLNTAAFALPQHISLKISFETEQADNILRVVAAFLSAQQPFSAEITDPEQEGNILWLPVRENTPLRWLHQQLDERLEVNFGVPQHDFDKCFKFHSTLFIDPDVDKVSQMLRQLQGYPFARTLQIDTFLLGVSETGKAGDYRVEKEIRL